MKQPLFSSLAALMIALLVLLVIPVPVQAINVNEYVIPAASSNPFQIVAGPDGSLWFTESAGGKIGRITPGGAITEFPLPNPFTLAEWLAAGPDGNLWFTESNPGNIHNIGRITPQGVVTEFPIPNPSDSPYSLIAGKNGVLWYLVAGRKIGRITVGGAMTEFALPVTSLNAISEIVAAADGSLFFVQLRSQNFPLPAEYYLGKLTPDGMFSEILIGQAKFFLITDLTISPDGNLWVSTISGPDAVGSEAFNGFRRLDADGTLSQTFIATRALAPEKIIVGPNGNFWFLADIGPATNRIGRVTPEGAVAQYETIGINRFTDLTSGPDGNLWLIDPLRNVVSRLTPDQPTDLVVTRASSFVSGAMAAESIATIFGASLTTVTESASSLPLPDTLAGISVKVKDSSGTERTASLFFASPSQINFLVPSATLLGNATVAVTSSSGQLISTGTMIIDSVAPGLFAADATGTGLAAALVQRVRADGSQVYEPIVQRDANNNLVAVPIDLGPEGDQVFLVLFGSGVRGHSGLSSASAFSEGGLLPVVYAGPQGGFVGLDQINLRLPRTLAGRGDQNVVVSVDQRAANKVRIRIK